MKYKGVYIPTDSQIESVRQFIKSQNLEQALFDFVAKADKEDIMMWLR